jgi:chemosensory pili system protein ChpA (sensor histidine kinase/response regulator)
MGETHDLMNLDWVQADIEQSLKQAQEALEAYLGDAVSAHLQTSYDAIHQVHGSLKMAGVPGAIMLAEQTENLLRAMLDETVDDLDGACNALAQALVYMPSYLNRVKSDAEDAPALLHTVMNDIRHVLGEEPIDEIVLFNPDLGPPRERASAEVKARFDNVSQADLRKFRQVYQFSLIGLIRREDVKVNTARLSNVLARLQQICQTAPINQLWEVATAFVESLLIEGTELNAGTLDLLRSLEREIKEFIHAGVFALDRQAHPVIMKGMLYWVAKSSQTGPHIQSIRQAYDLDRYELGDAYGEKATLLAGPDPETFRMVAAALGEELDRVKDSVDLYMRSSNKANVDLGGMLPSLNQIASTLVMLNFEAPRLVVQEQVDALKAKLDSGAEIPESLLLQLAEALLFVEAELETLAGHVQGVDQDVPSALVGAASEVVIKESLSSLRKAKDLMHAFLGDDQNFSLLESVPNILRSAYGGLTMLSQTTTAQLVLSASQYIEDDIIAQQCVPDDEAIESLAEVMASVEFCLEGLAAKQPINNAILERAKIQIAKLGYPVEQTDGISSDEMSFDAQISQFEVTTDYDDAFVGQDELAEAKAISSDADDASPRQSALHEREWDVPEYARQQETEEPTAEVVDDSAIDFELSDQADADATIIPLHERDWAVPDYAGTESVEAASDDVDEVAAEENDGAIDFESEPVADITPLHERDWIVPAFVGADDAGIDESSELGSGAEAVAGDLPDDDWIVPDETTEKPELVTTPVELAEDDDDLIDEEILEIFTEEAEEVFEEINNHWPAYAADTSDHEALKETRRAFHTLKGSGRMVKADVISELAWSIENMLNRVVEGELPASAGICDLVNDVRPVLPTLLAHFQAKTTPEIDVQPWMTRADKLAAGEVVDEAGEQSESLVDEEGPDFIVDLTEFEEAVTEEPSVMEEELPVVDEAPVESDVLSEEIELSSMLVDELDTEVEEAFSASEDIFDDEEPDTVLYELFVKETEQHLAIVQDFINVASMSAEPVLVNDDLYRALHTLKGSAKMALLDVFAGIAEPTEQLALTLINAEQPVDAELQQALRTAHDLMAHAASLLPDNPQQEIEGSEQFVEQLLRLCQSYELSASEAEEAVSEAQGFIRNNVDSICDLTDGYEQWRTQADVGSPELSQLKDKAEQLSAAAAQIDVPPLQALLVALAQAFENISAQQGALNDVALQTLDDANNGLISLFDEIAASQAVSDTGELVERLADDLPLPNDEPEAVLDVDALPAFDAVTEEQSFESEAYFDEEPDAELIEIFLEEADEILEQASIAKQQWIDNSADASALDELQRCLHTLKGGARMAGIMGVGNLSHELESVYEDVAAGNLELNAELYDTVHACDDRIMDMLGELRTKLHCDSAADLISRVREFRAAGGVMLAAKETIEEQAASQGAGELLQVLATQIESSRSAANAGQALANIRMSLDAFQDAAYQATLNEPGDLSHIFREILTSVDEDELAQDTVQTELAEWLERLTTSLSEAQELQAIEQPAAAMPELNVVPAFQAADEVQDTRKPSQDNVRVSASLLEQLVDLAGETSVSRSRVEQQVNNYGYAIDEMGSTIERLREQLRRLENETETQILFRQEREGPSHEDFDPLEMDRYSRMQELSRALMESVSDLLDLKETLRDQVRVTDNLLLQQSRTNTELHEGLMKARMVPFSRLVPRLRRLVRQVSGELNKRVDLDFKNPETELDRSLLEHMTAPLEHMLRNAVDHGMESAERRKAAGKPVEGQVTLSLARDGGDIVLRLQDDGAGIDIERVKAKAVERGLMAADAKLTDREILQFILQQGFSTAEKVTQISGRGVGMDVVHSEIRQLGGSITIDSEAGQGTTFTVRLPFTVSISRALMVNVGEDVFALPLSSIEGVVRINPYELEEYFKEDGPDFEYAGVKYDLHNLGDFVERAHGYQGQGGVLPLPVILVRTSDHAIAVQVDSISGSREVVVKPLGPQLSKVPGMSGATILGDGRVVLILDMAAMIREHLAREGIEQVEGLAAEPAVSASGQMQVMVVDDSVTVRKVASRLLERHGMEVILAKDGVEAMTKLQEVVPSIMLLDIEMPRMDGFELASLVRHDDNLKDIPIVMISSRTGDKHQARAREIGVNKFMGKPFQESDLLEAISELTGAEFETEGA